MDSSINGEGIRADNPVLQKIGRVIIWILLIALAAFTLIPFVWMISSSLKLDREVFAFPMRWIPETFHWENYSLIWQRVPLLTYFKNTAFIAIVVTILQTLTSSFAAYAEICWRYCWWRFWRWQLCRCLFPERMMDISPLCRSGWTVKLSVRYPLKKVRAWRRGGNT